MDQPSKSESFSVLNIAPTRVSLKARNLVGFLPLLLLGFTTPFLLFQDPWPSRASVESPLDGQKVTFTSLLLPVLLCPLPLFSLVCLCVCTSCHTLVTDTLTVCFHSVSEAQSYCSVICHVVYLQTWILFCSLWLLWILNCKKFLIC